MRGLAVEEVVARRARMVVSTLGVAAMLVLATGARVAAANSYDVYACSAGQGSYLNPSGSPSPT